MGNIVNYNIPNVRALCDTYHHCYTDHDSVSREIHRVP